MSDSGSDMTDENGILDLPADLPPGEDLTTDLHRVFTEDFKFDGTFYHCKAKSWPTAPDPELDIAGAGPIELPLSEKDAKAIIAVAAQAPFGKGVETVVDTTVRNTWEIEPSKITFKNKVKWDEFVFNAASYGVWKSLGVAPFVTPPRVELHKLLVYEAGSHFAPHQDTAKAEGMFATVIIVLPCDFEGGEVRLSHAGSEVTLDVAKDASDCKTTVLAWYTDVMHEVKPVTSGYRLALSYNLIHTSPAAPVPAPPSLDGPLAKLRGVMQGWMDGTHKRKPKVPILARILRHQYSASGLSKGIDSLKGFDAHLVTHLVSVAEELGFCVCVAELERKVVGGTDDCGENNYDPKMIFVDKDEIEIVNPVELTAPAEEEGSAFLLDKLEKIGITLDSVVPRNAFESVEPDSVNYEGYHGNESGPLEHQYRVTVVVMYHPKDTTDIVVGLKGPDWAWSKINTKSITLKERPIIEGMLANILERPPKYEYRRSHYYSSWNDVEPSPPSQNYRLVLHYAIEWADHEMWNKIYPYNAEKGDGAKARTLGMKVFKLDQMRDGLLAQVKEEEGLTKRFEILQRIIADLGYRATRTWIVASKKELIASYKCLSPETDVDLILSLAEDKAIGLEFIYNNLLDPNNPKNLLRQDRLDSTHSWRIQSFASLARGLHDRRATLFIAPTAPADLLPNAITRCLFGASWKFSERPGRVWAYEGPIGDTAHHTRSDWVSDIVGFVDLHLHVRESCGVRSLEVLRDRLLPHVLTFPGRPGPHAPPMDMPTRFWLAIGALMPEMRAVAKKHGFSSLSSTVAESGSSDASSIESASTSTPSKSTTKSKSKSRTKSKAKAVESAEKDVAVEEEGNEEKQVVEACTPESQPPLAPFKDFTKTVIEKYLTLILGSKPPAPCPALPTMTLDGWHYSYRMSGARGALSDFLNATDKVTVTITDSKSALESLVDEMEAPHKQHNVNAAFGVKALVTWTPPVLKSRLRREWAMEFEKKPEMVKMYGWETRIGAARRFLESFLGELDGEGQRELEAIMGERAGDVMKALDGEGYVIDCSAGLAEDKETGANKGPQGTKRKGGKKTKAGGKKAKTKA